MASASRAGVVHTVTVDAAGAYACDCEAGRHGKPCWHAAAVYVARVEHASGGRVTGAGRAGAGLGLGATTAAAPEAPCALPAAA